MPYKEGTKWRAHVKFKGERFTCLKDTKEAAKRWEAEEKKRLKSLKKETGIRTPVVAVKGRCHQFTIPHNTIVFRAFQVFKLL